MKKIKFRKLKQLRRKLRNIDLRGLSFRKLTVWQKRLALAACSVVIAGTGVGMASIPHEEQPVSQELLEEAQAEEIAEVEEIEEEIRDCEEGCTLEEGHEGPCVVKKEDVRVVLKSTSMERDLKVKFVDETTGKVVTGTKFRMKMTDSAKKTKEYTDTDADGIIWVKDIEGGNYTVAMLDMDGFVTAKTMSAEVKKKIEYKVVEVAEEVKTESEVVVSQEDAEFGGAAKDDSTSGSAALKDTVEYVASSSKKVDAEQEIDKFGQKVYKEFKKDALGQKMYAVITAESAEFHEDKNADGKCDRCKADMPKANEPAACTKHTDKDNDQKCDTCEADVDASVHTHYDDNSDGRCDAKTCGACMGHRDENPKDCKCDVCGAELDHQDGDGDGKCDNQACFKNSSSETPAGSENPPSETPAGSENPSSGTPTGSEEGTDPQNQSGSGADESASRKNGTVLGFALRPVTFLRATSEKRFITYDTSSAPVYDTSSEPVYKTEGKTIYYGWQTIDGATYYFDKNGNKVTGQQVIQGVSYTFSSEGVRSGTIGIDVSKYQKNINWTKIKNAGVNFVMIRCGYRGYTQGSLIQDSMFVSHITGAKAAGLRVGIYFFSQAVNEAEAVEEASMAVSLAKKYGINMPIAIDSEYANGGKGRADGLSKSARTSITKAFCNTVKSAGYTPMVYASKSWFGAHLDASKLSGYRIWVAHYAEKCGYTGKYDIWQNTDKGKVDGYSGYLDMNISSI